MNMSHAQAWFLVVRCDAPFMRKNTMTKNFSFPARFALIVAVIVAIVLGIVLAVKPANAQAPAPQSQFTVAVPMISRAFSWNDAKQCEAAIKLAPPAFAYPLPATPASALESKCWPMVRMAQVFAGFAPQNAVLDWTFSTSINGTWKVAYIKIGDERIGFTFSRNNRDDVNAGVFYVQCKSEIDVVCGFDSPVARMVRVMGGITDPRYGIMGSLPVIWERWQDYYQCETFEDGSQRCASSAFSVAGAEPVQADDTPIEDEMIDPSE